MSQNHLIKIMAIPVIGHPSDKTKPLCLTLPIIILLMLRFHNIYAIILPDVCVTRVTSRHLSEHRSPDGISPLIRQHLAKLAMKTFNTFKNTLIFSLEKYFHKTFQI
jgi:hypothetical protein